MPAKKLKTDADLITWLDQTDSKLDESPNCLTSTYYVFDRPDWDEIARQANNLYNESTYLVRHYPRNKGILTYTKLNQIIKQQYEDKQNLLYHSVAYLHTAQYVMKQVTGNFSNFYKAKRAYKKNSHKFSGKPRIPRYHKKGTRTLFTLSNQNAHIKNGSLISKKINLKLKLNPTLQHFKLLHVDFLPITHGFKVCVVFETHQNDFQKDNGIYISIDPGVDNAFTCICNKAYQPLIINGKNVKAVNHYYNKRKAELYRQLANNHQLESIIPTKQGPKPVYQASRKIERLNFKHNRKIDLFIYKAIKHIVDYALSCNAKTIFIGKNKGWKNKVKLGKANDQNFLGIPHAIVIEKLKLKAARYGIRVVPTNESYTSQTSFLDGEKPCRQNGNIARKNKHLTPINRRIKRGLFKSNQGILINSDVNGALQITKKGYATFTHMGKKKHIYVFPELSFDQGIKGLVLSPVKVDCLI